MSYENLKDVFANHLDAAVTREQIEEGEAKITRSVLARILTSEFVKSLQDAIWLDEAEAELGTDGLTEDEANEALSDEVQLGGLTEAEAEVDVEAATTEHDEQHTCTADCPPV